MNGEKIAKKIDSVCTKINSVPLLGTFLIYGTMMTFVPLYVMYIGLAVQPQATIICCIGVLLLSCFGLLAWNKFKKR